MTKRLSKAQKTALIAWISEGITPGEINTRARAFKKPFEVSRETVNYYRKQTQVDVKEIIKREHKSAMESGLALKAARIKKLKRLAKKLEADLLVNETLWVTNRFGEERFNASEVDQYRGVLDDIAREMGERSIKVDAPPIGPIEVRFIKSE
ncbi:MAG: hypothetical protein ABFD24_06105 [Anaerolineaceae bacterium]